MRSAREKPDSSRHFLDRHVRRLRSRGRSGGCRSGRRKVAGVRVYSLPGHSHLRSGEVIRSRGEARRKLQAADDLVIGEGRADEHIAQVDVVRRAGDPGRQLRRGVDGKSERAPIGREHIDDGLPLRGAKVRQASRRIERGTHSRDWMSQQFSAAVIGRRRRDAACRTARGDVVSHSPCRCPELAAAPQGPASS